MNESLKSKRVIFKKEKQKNLINSSKNELSLTWNDFAKILNISSRQLIDWRNEKNSMTLGALNKICLLTKKGLPKNISIKNQYWYTKKAGKIGGQAIIKKYGMIGGDQNKRKECWKKWWEKKGKFNENLITYKKIPVKRPRKSKRLAEFVGIMLGDGGISQRQIFISLHREDDKKYIIFVSNLVKNLFDIKPSIYHKPRYSVKNIVVSRTELVDFCVSNLELKIGNKIKQQVDIPNWIKKNKNFMTACVRGLIDTDGSIFDHNYFSGKKKYCYKKLSFTSHSKPLLNSVHNHLTEIGIKTRIARKKDLWIDSINDVKEYFSIVGSHNEKHLKRYKK